jgi:hypothetical protein
MIIIFWEMTQCGSYKNLKSYINFLYFKDKNVSAKSLDSVSVLRKFHSDSPGRSPLNPNLITNASKLADCLNSTE